MRKLLMLAFLLVGLGLGAQHAVYISPSFGPYLTSDLKSADTYGYSVEVGYCYDGQVGAGLSYGTLDLPNKAPYIQARTSYVLLNKSRFALSIAGGLGYVFNANQLIGEGDVVANVHINSSWDFTVAFASQGVYGMGYLPAVNVGFCKTFEIKKK